MRLTIILVAPARAENIGAAARAMKTMGFTQLRIVDSEAHLEPATRWVAHGSGDIIEELALADVLTGVPMVADYPSLNLGQAVMVYCYQLAGLIQQPARNIEMTDEHQLQALRERVLRLLATLNVSDDIKLTDWLQQRMGLLEQRDTAMLHRFLHDIEKNLTK